MGWRDWFTVPNSLTMLRFALTPCVVAGVVERQPVAAAWLFVIAAATDAVDGWFARRFGAATTVGLYLDPIADKVLLSATFLALAAAGSFPWWVVLVVFGRDLYLMIGSTVLLTSTGYRDLAPNVWGKLSTLLQVLAVAAALAGNAWQNSSARTLAAILVWPIAILAAASALIYTLRFLSRPISPRAERAPAK